MDTLVRHAENGKITHQMETVSRVEGIDPDIIADRIAAGRIVIMQRGERMTGIGAGLSTKINVNLGTSTGKISIEEEIKKVRIAEQFGADTISDLSMGGDIDATRNAIVKNSTRCLSPPSRSTRRLLKAV